MEEIYHKYKQYNGENTLVIYVNYPDEYEFALDFDSLKKNVKKVTNKIREYAFKNIGTVSNQAALLVLNGVVVGTILLNNLGASKQVQKLSSSADSDNLKENIEINRVVPIENELSKEFEQEKEENIEVKQDDVQKINITSTSKTTSNKAANNSNVSQKTSTNTSTTANNNATNNSSNVNQQASTPTTQVPNNTNNNTNTTNSTNTSTPASTPSNTQTAPAPVVSNEKMINLRLTNGNVISIALEEYLVGVVGAEMPASFNIEALKAQAIAARTYALKKSSAGKTLSATTADQVYKTNDELKAMWGGSFNTYYNKVKTAVDSTKGMYMTYNGTYIDALYFSTSNGKTEDPIYVWGTNYPYLKSVDSSVDKNVSSYKYTKTMNLSDFCSKLGVSVSSNSDISVLSKTSGDRVDKISIGGKTFTGVKVRELLGLRSADFNIDISSGIVTIVTYGYGHGCGMSQYGANELAKKGYSYSQILNHYYTGIAIQK